MRHLVPWPGIEPGPPALGTWSLTHWTTRQVPGGCGLLTRGGEKGFWVVEQGRRARDGEMEGQGGLWMGFGDWG